jgi:hypothetical protein
MIAYCHVDKGEIQFGEKKPRFMTTLGEHPDAEFLRRIVEDLAQAKTVYRNGIKTRECLSVPWFQTAKDSVEQIERVKRFARRVTGSLNGELVENN